MIRPNPKCLDISPVESDILGGDILVETAGYVPKEEQLRILTQSGEALDAYRRRVYPTYVPIDNTDDVDPAIDPTVAKGYDIFDAYDSIRVVKSKMTDIRKAELADQVRITEERKLAAERAAGQARLDNTVQVTPDKGVTQ